MEAIGDQLGEFSASGGVLPRVLPRNEHFHNVYDGGTLPGRPGRFHAVPTTADPPDSCPAPAYLRPPYLRPAYLVTPPTPQGPGSRPA